MAIFRALIFFYWKNCKIDNVSLIHTMISDVEDAVPAYSLTSDQHEVIDKVCMYGNNVIAVMPTGNG